MQYWTIKQVKSNAKLSLNGCYWWTVLAMLILSFFTGGSSVVTLKQAYNKGFTTGTSGFGFTEFGIAAAVLGFVFVTAFSFGIIYSAFVAGPFEVGRSRYLTSCRYKNISLKNIFYGFSQGKYWSNVGTMLVMNIKIILWSLLFFIPGIIKSIQFSMVPFIIAENPNITTKRALEISKKMTHGEKWHIFGLYLSFIGWFILASLTAGIGYIFLSPYVSMTDAELYAALRVKAINEGICTREELGADL